MKQLRVLLMSILALTLVVSGLLTSNAGNASAAVNDYVSVTKTVTPGTITTLEEATVSLNITGTPPTNVVVPNDVVLIIDKSGSMVTADDRIGNAKQAAKGFIDLMDFSKHRVGIVDFSDTDKIGTFDLTTDKDAAKNHIDTITAKGSTATGDAIQKATEMLANHRPEAQPVIVILTDGDATVGSKDYPNAYDYAKYEAGLAKDAGVIFYTIALLNATDNPETSKPNILLKEMATTSNHHHFVLGATGLDQIYAAIVREIGLASAFDVKVNDIVAPEFEIVPGSYDNNIPKPTVNGNSLTWEFNELKDKTLTFEYKIRPVDKTKKGTFAVSTGASQITYKDYAGAQRSKLIPSANLAVKFPAPTVTSVVYSSGLPAGGNTVTITGDHFMSGASVKFGSTSASNVQVVDAQTITAVVPAGTQGTVSVVVTNTDGQFATGQYQYKADPTVTLIDPNKGDMAGGYTIGISGKYYMPGMTVKIGANLAQVDTNNGSKVIVKVPASTVFGPVDVTLTNPDGTTVTVAGGFTYNEPPKKVLTITSVSPNSGLTAGGESVYINGDQIASNATVYFGNTVVPITSYYNGGVKILVIAPASTTAGAVDIKIVNPDGQEATLAGAYTYNAPPPLPAPTITTLSATSGLVAGGEYIYVNGSNFVNGLKVYFGTTEAKVNAFYSSVKIQIQVPAGPSAGGTIDVKVVNPDGQEGSKAGGYTYQLPPPPPAPTITSLSATSGLVAGGDYIYVNGANFVNGVKVYMGSTEARVNYFYSASKLQILVPAGPSAGGAVDIKVVNPDGQEGTLAAGYTYNVPAPEPVTITAITPNTGLMSGGNYVYIDGVNFKANAQVTFGTNTVKINSLLSTTRVQVQVPASTVAGAVNVTLTNTDGQTFTLAGGYTYTVPVPTITTLSPNHVALNTSASVYIDGTNFDPNMTVTVNGKSVAITSYYSSNRILIVVPASSTAGQVPIVVTLPSGAAVTANFTYDAPPPAPAPTITKLSATSGSATTVNYIYIDGSGFASGVKFYIGGVEATVNAYYGATRVQIKLPTGTPGAKTIVAVNPDGQTSNAMTYTYN
ncbi:IPT/TIG domain-containing protein [Paenibacillus kobensis]|uniref:IPT/TIG domain-containing protein n=1 Tax=Paenibacillus kobensis TaxID=59841 RepID=UPI000FD7D8BF|nr:IPT/TIG domain-containing protein [Paenibacillus kobensis]